MCVGGGGVGGQRRSRDQHNVNSFIGLTVCVFYSSRFNHLVF